MKTVIITEKPSVAQEYKKVLKISGDKKDGYIEGHSPVLNKEVIITWAVGHLIGICTPEEHNEDWKVWKKEHLPMIPNRFQYRPLPDTYKQYKVIKEIYTRSDLEAIYYAGDSGREGIYIQALIRNQIFKTPPTCAEKVVWIDSYTEESILKGIREAKPYHDYLPMIQSGYQRAISDWLIGMNFTEAFTLSCGGYKNVVNVGRVMTPTLAMIVNRQKEIDTFTKTYFYGIKATEGICWKATKESRFFESDLLYNENGFLKKKDAEELISSLSLDKKLTVSSVNTQTKTEYAPYNFNLADLQNECSKRFHISPDDTLKIAQSLYEKKFTTYPRTDSRFLTEAVAKELRAKYSFVIPSRYIDDSKVTDHYALIPTFQGNAESLQGLEERVYQVIHKRFMTTMKPPYVYDAYTVTYLHANKEPFYEAFRIVKQQGFKDISEEDRKSHTVPKKGEVLVVPSFTLRDMETKPPVAYTTGSLILAMEKAGKLIEDEELREQIKTCGIGTSATRASIIEKLKNKEFITVDKSQKITPTAKSMEIIPIIASIDETLTSPIKTADMETRLGSIANRTITEEQYQGYLYDYVKQTTTSIFASPTRLSSNQQNFSNEKHETFACPCCEKPLKNGRFGFYCDKNEEGCGFNFSNEVCGHKFDSSDLKSLIANGRTKVYSMTSKSGNKFKACLVLNKAENKTNLEFEKQKER